MKYRLKFTRAFNIDLLEMDFYLSEHPQKAKRIFEKIDKDLKALTDMPKMYPIYEDFPVFRKIAIEDYLLFYTVNENNKTIEVHRLIYGRMDILSAL